eukprot:6564829-Alexandrium_andersonii.AAC.1
MGGLDRPKSACSAPAALPRRRGRARGANDAEPLGPGLAGRALLARARRRCSRAVRIHNWELSD